MFDPPHIGVENLENGGPGGKRKKTVPVRHRRQLRRISDVLMESEIGPFIILFVMLLSTYVMWHARGTWVPLLLVWIPMLVLGVLLAPNTTEDILVGILKISILPVRKSTWSYLCCCLCRAKLCGRCVSCGCATRACKRLGAGIVYCVTCNKCCGACVGRSSGYAPVAQEGTPGAAAAGGVPRERQEPLRSRKTPEEGVQKSMVEEILALNKLKTEGILSEAEFSLAKAKLLGSKKKN